jgi:hypothetical protein
LGGEVRPVSVSSADWARLNVRVSTRLPFVPSRVSSGLDVVGIEHVGELGRRLAA